MRKYAGTFSRNLGYLRMRVSPQTIAGKPVYLHCDMWLVSLLTVLCKQDLSYV
jgi:hypothetical protein